MGLEVSLNIKPISKTEVKKESLFKRIIKNNFFEFLSGFANSADIFPIYIGDDRTDEDAFKVYPILRM